MARGSFAGSLPRKPLQPRSMSSLNGGMRASSTRSLGSMHRSLGSLNGVVKSSSASDSDEMPSKEMVNRLSNLESSNNDNNKRIVSVLSASLSCRRGSSTSSLVGSGSEADSSLTTNPGVATSTGRSKSAVRSRAPAVFPRTTPAIEAQQQQPQLTKTSVIDQAAPQPATDGDDIILEKRRRLDGEGYTYHRYRRGKMLGKGGFAKVYMCTALDTNKNYAVKIVPKANLVKARQRQKLQAEIKIHRTLKHAHVCEYKHFFEDKENCYVLLELCHNQSMNEMIKRRKRLTEPEAILFMKQLLEAVDYMHSNCVIHRDLKLGNLFLDKHMNIKVGDLGLATRLENAEEKRKTICGTPNYIAPEVIQGTKETRGHSFEVDIWSMGVILYTFLVGKPPYEAKDVKATYRRIIDNDYSFPHRIPISSRARSLIESMLQSKPETRPSLNEIRDHPFFTSPDAKIPLCVPSSATRTAPTWTVNEFGELVPLEDDRSSNSSTSKPVSQQLPKSAPQRKPFGNKDANAESWQPSAGDVRSSQTSQGLTGTMTAIKASKTGFEIYDETDTASSKETRLGRPPKQTQARSSPDEFDELASKTKALALDSNPASSGQANFLSDLQRPTAAAESDSDILVHMLARLCSVLEVAEARKHTYLSAKPRPASQGGPSRWITRYVDYTTKYGLGFLLNDGSSGVYFNDSTKSILDADGETFHYIERKRPSLDADDDARRLEPTCETHTLSSYPEGLQKKVTLLKHFHNYLIEQQAKDGDSNNSSSDKAIATANEPLSTVLFLKKWVRTKHAVLFRLSDHTVQVVFYDQTEVLLTPDERFLTYVDKNRNRCTYHLNDELIGSNPELAKRVKYSKEILQQLATSQKR